MIGSVTGVTINAGGSYAPTGTITATFSAPTGGGTRATGNVHTAVLTGTRGRRRLSCVTITNESTGYTSTPTITFSLTGIPSATVTVRAGLSVASVTVTIGGSGYSTAPAVTFGAPPF